MQRQDEDEVQRSIIRGLRKSFPDAESIEVRVEQAVGSPEKCLVDVYLVSPSLAGLTPVQTNRAILKSIGHMLDFDKYVLAAGGHSP